MSRLMPFGMLLAALLVLAAPAGTGLAQECADLPRSDLKVYGLQADHVTEHAATPEEIARMVNAGTGSAPHLLMAIADEIDTHFALVHRLVESPDGGYCDAPEVVVIRFGIISRHVFLAPQALREGCVREALLAHEADHDRALNAAVSAFIQQHRDEVVRDLTQLKSKRAFSEGAAKQALEAGLKGTLARLLEQFKKGPVGRIRQSIDSAASIAELRRSCNGRLGELEKSAREGGKAL